MVEAWNVVFGKAGDDFTITHGDIFAGPKADAIVSPANSFGFMDGGIDAVYEDRFGVEIPMRLREHIKNNWHGEIPVGQATIIATNDEDYPWLISAPTMRVPESVKGTVNAYLAFRAVLLAVKKWNETWHDKERYKINSILCPGLGTAVGEMPVDDCAIQMWRAYTSAWLDKPMQPEQLADAYWHHRYMAGERRKKL